ncbi:cardiolipin synthase [Oceanisphaera pacifica]|uniref:Cardiolipin synthase n=1 Tax=Oceanisphaera pacifica TaxID=2818389 RepID=A0ABS3NFT9_9GAMM|nr:cardiolipin synthase [Oceanisphaera pacifica]MBO1519151.1 cardiolipin synthase [Oceanisphaera pacifica]
MTIVVTLHFILVMTFTARILLRDDLSPPGRLAWFIVLNVLPYFGVATYFLFGEIDIGNRAIKRHDEIFDEIKAKASAFMGEKHNTDTLIDPLYRPGFHYAGSINGFHTLGGNRAELMADGDETRERLVADIDGACDHVHVLYYIWLNDEMGNGVAQALIRAARRGVTCRAMADGLGSRALIKSPLWQEMKDAGVELAVALSFRNLIKTILLSRFDLRNHRKITVIDASITYCGSRNSADPEFLPKAKYGPWVDIMLRFEGPVVAQNQLLFASDWMQATDESLDQFKLHIEPNNSLATESQALSVPTGFPAQVMGVGPTERRGATPQLFANLIASAQRELIISTPYFVPDATLLESLCAAAHRGVAVTLIYPKVNDSWVVSAASRSYYHQLLDAGCVIYEFKGGLLHAKTLTIDGRISLIGSSNLDLRSFDLNYENNILLQDIAITQAIYERQQVYISQSEVVELATVLAWPYHRRIWNNVIATIGPVL